MTLEPKIVQGVQNESDKMSEMCKVNNVDYEGTDPV